MQGSRGENTCGGHVEVSRIGACELSGVICIYEWVELYTVDSLRVKRRCQLIVRLKANKCYQELLCSLSSYINLLNLLNLQGLRGWLQASSRFQTSSLWSRSQTSDLCRYSYSFSCLFDQLFLGKVCRNPTTLGWVVWLWSLDQLFATSFVCNSGPLHNRSRLSSTSLSSSLSGLPSNRAQLCVTVLDCPRLHQAVVCRICQAIMRDFGGLVARSVGFCLCKLFLTIGSSNCELSKTKSIYK